ncbi:MAG TPA: dTDP-4-dehydrorhamnose reductase [Planctomycetales bacterium]|jgi:dTDP-4-dehydrorhamnose reductase|nr:dTDP-4-dehydrorhamnose reductase [Planctomycetales bacterium]
METPTLLVNNPTSRLPLLITGVSGVAGWNALPHFLRLWPGRVIGIRPTTTWQLVADGVVALDTGDRAGLQTLFEKHRFGAVLNCTGNCALKPCELDPAMARRTNVDAAVNIATLARRHGTRLVHLSSDLVFSGSGAGGYVETDSVDPVTVYGRTMAQGEQAVREIDPEAAILRISLPMGPSFNRHAGAIDWIQSRFRNGRPATLYFDEVRSCTYADDLNRVFERFLANHQAGVFHCGGPRAITLYQIAQIVNRVGGYDPELLKGCPRVDAGPMPPRAGNVSMNSGKLIAVLGGEPFQPWPVGEDLLPTDREWHFARPIDELGGARLLAERLYRYPASSATVGL